MITDEQKLLLKCTLGGHRWGSIQTQVTPRRYSHTCDICKLQEYLPIEHLDVQRYILRSMHGTSRVSYEIPTREVSGYINITV